MRRGQSLVPKSSEQPELELIDMEMDDSTVTLRAGDVMVQRGTNHAWVNRGNVPARLAIVLLDAKPLGIGRPRVRGQQAR